MEFIDLLTRFRVLPVAKSPKADMVFPIMGALCSGGISLLCIAGWNEEISVAVRAMGDMCVGARVSDKTQTRLACEAGASFVCSYGFSESTAEICAAHGVRYVPGCITPSDIAKAEDMGLRVVMLCPADLFGGSALCDRYISMFPRMKFIVCGAPDEDDIGSYLENPRLLAFCSSRMTEGTLDEIAEKSRLHMIKYSKA